MGTEPRSSGGVITVFSGVKLSSDWFSFPFREYHYMISSATDRVFLVRAMIASSLLCHIYQCSILVRIY